VLVGHENDIAACASRVCTFRDGRLVSDIRQETPSDAAAELARLPVERATPSLNDADEEVAAAAGREPIGAPVPFRVYAAMFFAGLLGHLLGLTYSAVIVGQSVVWIPVLCTFVAESYAGARVGRRALGKPLTGDQRARMALYYTLGTGLLLSPLFYFKLDTIAPRLSERLAHGGGADVAIFLGALALTVTALSLLRYLTLSIFTPGAAKRA
jgi:putative ABC transport system ATP-binding protein